MNLPTYIMHNESTIQINCNKYLIQIYNTRKKYVFYEKLFLCSDRLSTLPYKDKDFRLQFKNFRLPNLEHTQSVHAYCITVCFSYSISISIQTETEIGKRSAAGVLKEKKLDKFIRTSCGQPSIIEFKKNVL